MKTKEDKKKGTKSIEVRDLKPGDVLAFTYAEVVTTPVYIGTGSGRLDFIVKTVAGEFVAKSLNRHRLVMIAV